MAAAFPDADAAVCGVGERPAVTRRETEIRRRIERIVRRPFPQVDVDCIGVDDLAWIHPVLRIPDTLERAKRFDDPFAVHDRQQRGPGLAVAVFAGERAAVAANQLRRFQQKGFPSLDSRFRMQVEGDIDVDAALPKVAVQGAEVAVLLKERA